MEKEYRVLNEVKSQIEKAIINFQKSPKARINQNYIDARLETLEKQFQNFSSKHESIIGEYGSQAILDYYKEDIYDSVYETYLYYKVELKNALSKLKPVKSDSEDCAGSSDNVPRRSVVKLPKIVIPTFSGKYTEWSSFRDLFISLVHKNKSLDDVQRLHYLKTQLSGEAEQLIRHVPITENNYTKCWEMLEHRYNNKKFMSTCILKRLFSQRNMLVESSSALKELLDVTSDCLHELTNLGIDVASWDVIVIYIVSLKLDVESRKQWELNVSKSSADLPTFTQFTEFLETRFRALEFVEPTGKTHNNKVSHSNVANPKVMLSTSKLICPHCSEDHRLPYCKKFAKENVDQRRDIVQSLGVCYNCLGTSHINKFCRVFTKCRICKRKHHTLLHPKNQNDTAVATPTESVTAVDDTHNDLVQNGITTNIATHFSKGNAHGQVLLATALVRAESKNGSSQVLRALLDQGSQASFITEAAAQLLRVKKIATKSAISGIGGGHGDVTSKYVVRICIQSLHDPSYTIAVTAHVLSSLTSVVPDKGFEVNHWPELRNVQLADPYFNSPNKIDILLGAEIYCHILKGGLIKGPKGATIAQNTCLGWIVSGHVEGKSSLRDEPNVIISMHTRIEENGMLKRQWELDSEPLLSKRPLITEEQACEDCFAVPTPFLCEDPKKQKWRKHPVCLTANILKMYRHIKVAEEHMDFQSIVWRDNAAGEIHDYRLLTVTFGTSCAPYLAVKALQQTACDEEHKYHLAAENVKNDFYMDDLMTGCQSEKEAIQLYKDLNELLQRGGFKLQKWTSNKINLLEGLKEYVNRNLEIKMDTVIKILGLTWNRNTDEFDYTVKMSPPAAPETKRSIISEISRLYDPLGWIAPCIVTSKVFIQKLWIAGVGWDDELPLDLLRDWEFYRGELSNLINFHLPRWITKKDDNVTVELHGFSDASNMAYAAVVYSRIVDSEGNVHCNLLTAKTKVAPIKQVSVPRLELCGAVLVAKLLTEVAQVLVVPKVNLHAWTDSTVVLAWLNDHPSRWKTFVANRTSEILNLLDNTQLAHVQSKDNPADIASRGISPKALLENDLWKQGLKWLGHDQVNYPRLDSTHVRTNLEQKIKVHSVQVDYDDDGLWSRFSSLRRLVRVIAFCRRFLLMSKYRKAHIILTPYLFVTELKEALNICLSKCQRQWFSEEIKALETKVPINKKSILFSLSLFIDNCGIMRVGGRIQNAQVSTDMKHPVVVPSKSILAKLIVAYAHERTFYGGQQLMVNFIRSRYWVSRVKNLLRAHIHTCVPCIRYAAVTKNLLMGELPSCRVTPSKPFLNTGVDYPGPINLRVSKGRGQRSYKGYICLSVCMVTRAVHLESVSDMTTEGHSNTTI